MSQRDQPRVGGRTREKGFGSAIGSVAARHSGRTTCARDLFLTSTRRCYLTCLAQMRALHKEIFASTADNTAAFHERLAKSVHCRDETKLLLTLGQWLADLEVLQAAGSSPPKENVSEPKIMSCGWHRLLGLHAERKLESKMLSNDHCFLHVSSLVNVWHKDGHCGRLLRHPDSFQAHCGVPTFLVFSQ